MTTRAAKSLLAKELSHHKWALLGLLVLIAMSFAVLVFKAFSNARTLTLFSASGGFLYVMIPLCAIVLGNRLVVSEYFGRTQLFVEALPIPRWQMVTVKYLIGLVFLQGMMGLNLFAVGILAARSEPVEFLFVGKLMLRAATFIYCIWSFLFLMGFLGRLRFPIYICCALALGYIESSTQLRIGEFGPFVLANPDRFGLERYDLPMVAMIQTLFVGTGILLLAYGVALIREGSIAEILAHRMSQREKAVVAVLMLSLVLALYVLDRRTEKAPFEFTETAVVRSDSLPIAILYGHSTRQEHALKLIKYLERVFGELKTTLRIEKLPPIRVAYFSTLDADVYQPGRIKDADGILVRANFTAKKWSDSDFTAYLVHQILSHTTKGRAVFEPKHWLLDGFSVWWATEQLEQSRRLEARDKFMLRALFATRNLPLYIQQIEHWTLYQEKLGPRMSSAVAYSGIKYLEQTKGKAAVLELARAVLSRRPPRDARETIYEMFNSMSEIFSRSTGLKWTRFVADWSAWLQDRSHIRQELEQRLLDITPMNGIIWLEKTKLGIRDIVYQFQLPGSSNTDSTCSLVHVALSPYEWPIRQPLLKREEQPCKDAIQEPVRLSGFYGEGQRVFVALEVDSEPLGCRVRLAADRIEIN